MQKAAAFYKFKPPESLSLGDPVTFLQVGRTPVVLHLKASEGFQV